MTLLPGLMLLGVLNAVAAAKPAGENRAAPWEPCVQVLRASAYDMQAVRRLAGTTAWKQYRDNPVVKLGGQGQWDSGALGSMTVIQVGNIYHMYYEAWGDKGTGGLEYHSLQIGHAVSPDGLHWAKDPANPVLSPEPGNNWDQDGVWDPFVIYENGQFKMWYGGGDANHCDWAFAASADGSHFVKKSRISHLGNVEDDHVVHDTAQGVYRIYYWDRAPSPAGCSALLPRMKPISTSPMPLRSRSGARRTPACTSSATFSLKAASGTCTTATSFGPIAPTAPSALPLPATVFAGPAGTRAF